MKKFNVKITYTGGHVVNITVEADKTAKEIAEDWSAAFISGGAIQDRKEKHGRVIFHVANIIHILNVAIEEQKP